MKKQQHLVNHSAAVLAVLLVTSTTSMARSTPVTIQNDASNPVPVEVLNNSGNASSRYQLVGTSTQKVDAESGILKLNNACEAEFPGSRMCTTVEIVNSKGTFSFPFTSWVNPVLLPPQPLVLPDGEFFILISEKVLGLVTSRIGFATTSINCSVYSSSNPGNSGIGVTGPDAVFVKNLNCATERPVSCCAAVVNQ